MRSKYEAYPFLSEKQILCDYELITDRFASEIGELYPLVKEEDKENVVKLCELVYHMNACIRTKDAPLESDVELVLNIGRLYKREIHCFMLPLSDSVVGGKCQLLRVRAKEVVRLLYKIDETIEVDQKLFDIFNILSQVFFELSLKYTDKEIEFTSRVYKSDF